MYRIIFVISALCFQGLSHACERGEDFIDAAIADQRAYVKASDGHCAGKYKDCHRLGPLVGIITSLGCDAGELMWKRDDASDSGTRYEYFLRAREYIEEIQSKMQVYQGYNSCASYGCPTELQIFDEAVRVYFVSQFTRYHQELVDVPRVAQEALGEQGWLKVMGDYVQTKEHVWSVVNDFYNDNILPLLAEELFGKKIAPDVRKARGNLIEACFAEKTVMHKGEVILWWLEQRRNIQCCLQLHDIEFFRETLSFIKKCKEFGENSKQHGIKLVHGWLEVLLMKNGRLDLLKRDVFNKAFPKYSKKYLEECLKKFPSYKDPLTYSEKYLKEVRDELHHVSKKANWAYERMS